MAHPTPAALDAAIVARLRKLRMRGDFAALHVAPATPAEVPDQAGARLVLLGPEHPHREGGESPGLAAVAALLERAGDGVARAYRNMLVFVAPDASQLDELRAAAERVDESPAAWQWLLVPTPEGLRAIRAAGRDELAMRASRALRAAGQLHVDYPPARLRADLDGVPLWPPGADHVELAALWDVYARSLRLPRLRSSATLAAAVVGGVAAPDWATATFAYADGFDGERYTGLVAGQPVVLRGSGLVVRAAAAARQLDGEPPKI